MIIFVADLFAEQYGGGAELTTEALIESSLLPTKKIISSSLTTKIMQQYGGCFWVFANFHQVPQECLLFAAQNLQYSVLEYDYKFCEYRSPEKHIEATGTCDCSTKRTGKLVSIFFNNAKVVWWMSYKQKEKYLDNFPFLKAANNKVLSSVLSADTLKHIMSLNTTNKNHKWVILNSGSWIKGTQAAVNYAEENKLEYEVIGGLTYEAFLQKLSISKGIIFFPPGGDTCPRMIIEAKLLECELLLNDNVQHKDETWFETKDSCLEYLKERTLVFWGEIEKYVNFLPTKTIKDSAKYIVVSPFYNAEKYLPKCIQSLKRQTHTNFKCILVDDMSSDKSVEVASEMIQGDNRFKIIKNRVKSFALKNIHTSLSTESINDDDIIILLDGDDWLSSSKSLESLNSLYAAKDCWATYGSYIMFPHGIRGPEPSQYPSSVVDNNLYRTDQWRASHLRTFKYHLWKKIEEEDLKNSQGEFYDVSYDQAIMLPILEMAGPRAKFVEPILHVYNKENPLNVDKVKTTKQVKTAQEIRNKKKYRRIQ